MVYLLSIEPSNPELPVYPALVPLNRKSLNLAWEFETPMNEDVLYNYTVILSVPSENKLEKMFVEINATESPTVVLDLSGLECEEFQVNISLPGNCDPATIIGSLLTSKKFLFLLHFFLNYLLIII